MSTADPHFQPESIRSVKWAAAGGVSLSLVILLLAYGLVACFFGALAAGCAVLYAAALEAEDEQGTYTEDSNSA